MPRQDDICGDNQGNRWVQPKPACQPHAGNAADYADRDQPAMLDADQMLRFASPAQRSISASSYGVKSSLFRAATFSSNWVMRLAPISAEVTCGWRNTQASAICARVWPRRLAISINGRILSSVAGAR